MWTWNKYTTAFYCISAVLRDRCWFCCSVITATVINEHYYYYYYFDPGTSLPRCETLSKVCELSGWPLWGLGNNNNNYYYYSLYADRDNGVHQWVSNARLTPWNSLCVRWAEETTLRWHHSVIQAQRPMLHRSSYCTCWYNIQGGLKMAQFFLVRLDFIKY